MGALEVVWGDWLMMRVDVGWRQQQVTAGASEEREYPV